MSAFPERVVGSACASAFSRLAQRSLALRPAHSRCHQFVARLPEGFSHFVASIAAPVPSGWSVCRVGFAPTGKRRLITAHTRCRHSSNAKAAVRVVQKRSRSRVDRRSRQLSHMPGGALVTMLRCVAISVPRSTFTPPLPRQVLAVVALSAPWWMKQNLSTAVSCSK